MTARFGWLLSFAFARIVMLGSSPAAFAGVASCPTGTIGTSNFASANLGATASKCGTVTGGANSVTVAIPTGYPGDAVEAWLNVQLNLPNGFQGSSASVLRFSNFDAVLGSTISFDWDSSFDPFSEGYVFALLDGQRTVLTEVVAAATTTSLTAQHAQLTITSNGLHDLALGIVDGCSADNCSSITSSLDPMATFSLITLNPAIDISTPEPATMSLMGLGLAGMVAGLVRRKRS